MISILCQKCGHLVDLMSNAPAVEDDSVVGVHQIFTLERTREPFSADRFSLKSNTISSDSRSNISNKTNIEGFDLISLKFAYL